MSRSKSGAADATAETAKARENASEKGAKKETRAIAKINETQGAI
jgi:hypothetical protein